MKHQAALLGYGNVRRRNVASNSMTGRLLRASREVLRWAQTHPRTAAGLGVAAALFVGAARYPDIAAQNSQVVDEVHTAIMYGQLLETGGSFFVYTGNQEHECIGVDLKGDQDGVRWEPKPNTHIVASCSVPVSVFAPLALQMVEKHVRVETGWLPIGNGPGEVRVGYEGEVGSKATTIGAPIVSAYVNPYIPPTTNFWQTSGAAKSPKPQ